MQLNEEKLAGQGREREQAQAKNSKPVHLKLAKRNDLKLFIMYPKNNNNNKLSIMIMNNYLIVRK